MRSETKAAKLPSAWKITMAQHVEKVERLYPQALLVSKELAERMLLHPGHENFVAPGAVEEIFKMPVDLRSEASQMVLHPALQVEPLRPRQAADCLRKLLLRQRELAEKWEAKKRTAVSDWLRELEKRGTKADAVRIVPIAYAEREQVSRGMRPALDMIPREQVTACAPNGLTWLELAIRHGLELKVVPDDKAATSELLVAMEPLLVGEQVRAEHGESPWLVNYRPRGRKTPPRTPIQKPPRQLLRRHTKDSWDWNIQIPNAPAWTPIGTANGIRYGIRPDSKGMCEWARIEDSSARARDPSNAPSSQVIKTSALKALRFIHGWDGIKTLTGISRSSWESFESTREMPFHTALDTIRKLAPQQNATS